MLFPAKLPVLWKMADHNVLHDIILYNHSVHVALNASQGQDVGMLVCAWLLRDGVLAISTNVLPSSFLASINETRHWLIIMCAFFFWLMSGFHAQVSIATFHYSTLFPLLRKYVARLCLIFNFYISHSEFIVRCICDSPKTSVGFRYIHWPSYSRGRGCNSK